MIASMRMDFAHPNPDIVVAEWVTRELSQDGWTESIRIVNTTEEARQSEYGTVTRTFLPDWKLEDFSETRISIVPVESMPQRIARCSIGDQVQTDVIFAKRTHPDKINKAADVVMELSQQVEYWFECHPEVIVECEMCHLHCRWMNGNRPRIYSLEHMHNMHLIATTLRFMTLCVKTMCCCPYTGRQL